MASQKAFNKLADIDASLATMAPVLPGQKNDDMVPLHVSHTQLQDDIESSASESSASPFRKSSLPRSRAKKVRKAAHQTQQTKPLLRPAMDILFRIRHDPALEEADFIVGYLDRHCPEVMEMECSSWKGGGDVTDEEWIPQHRIVYFRRKTDDAGRRIWDRAARLDRLFGSGVAAIERGGASSEYERGAQGAVHEQQEGETTERRTSDAKREFVERDRLDFIEQDRQSWTVM